MLDNLIADIIDSGVIKVHYYSIKRFSLIYDDMTARCNHIEVRIYGKRAISDDEYVGTLAQESVYITSVADYRNCLRGLRSYFRSFDRLVASAYSSHIIRTNRNVNHFISVDDHTEEYYTSYYTIDGEFIVENSKMMPSLDAAFSIIRKQGMIAPIAIHNVDTEPTTYINSDDDDAIITYLLTNG